MGRTTLKLQDTILDATETVVTRQGIANLTLDAVAAEARLSKGGLLHYFPSKDRLVEALVSRSAENWRSCYMEAYKRTSEGPGRMARALLLKHRRFEGHPKAEGDSSMKRVAAGVGVTGLGLMSMVPLVMCRSSSLGLEGRIVVFLVGAVLFVLGGSRYAAIDR